MGLGQLRVLTALAPEGSTVVDIGANLGTHTLLLATQVGPQGRVVSFEPQRLVFALLQNNVASNGHSNVQLVNACVGSEPGVAVIPELDLWGRTQTLEPLCPCSRRTLPKALQWSHSTVRSTGRCSHEDRR